MKRPLCKMGNPVLRQKARRLTPQEFEGEELARLLEDLQDSMKHYGGIGIAAPQIGVPWQVAIIELNNLNRYGQQVNLPLTTFVNPEIHYLGDETQGFWEGCLSVPGLRGFVERPRKVRVTYQDQEGRAQELEAEGFLATVLQHELDHLAGVLYVDRMRDLTQLVYQEEYEAFIADAHE